MLVRFFGGWTLWRGLFPPQTQWKGPQESRMESYGWVTVSWGQLWPHKWTSTLRGGLANRFGEQKTGNLGPDVIHRLCQAENPCIPNVGHDMKRAVMGSVLVLPQRSAEGKTRLTRLLGANVAGQVPVGLSWIHSGQESCKLDNLSFLLVGGWREAELSKNPQNIHEKKHCLLIPATGQKAWSQQMTEPVIQNFLVTLRPSETTTGKTEEAEISKAGTGEKI